MKQVHKLMFQQPLTQRLNPQQWDHQRTHKQAEKRLTHQHFKRLTLPTLIQRQTHRQLDHLLSLQNPIQPQPIPLLVVNEKGLYENVLESAWHVPIHHWKHTI